MNRFPQNRYACVRDKVRHFASCYDNDRDRLRFRSSSQIAENVAAVQPRQAEIEDDGTGTFLIENPERVGPVFDSNHCVPRGPQCPPIHLARGLIIFHEKDYSIPTTRHRMQYTAILPSSKLSCRDH